mmetsp:Transcript_89/g.164  ORF Transcript_89/g.164 Transcript_89/m.164 type:complete len:220 (-) Transcript_89:144-803(-)
MLLLLLLLLQLLPRQSKRRQRKGIAKHGHAKSARRGIQGVGEEGIVGQLADVAENAHSHGGAGRQRRIEGGATTAAVGAASTAVVDVDVVAAATVAVVAATDSAAGRSTAPRGNVSRRRRGRGIGRGGSGTFLLRPARCSDVLFFVRSAGGADVRHIVVAVIVVLIVFVRVHVHVRVIARGVVVGVQCRGGCRGKMMMLFGRIRRGRRRRRCRCGHGRS